MSARIIALLVLLACSVSCGQAVTQQPIHAIPVPKPDPEHPTCHERGTGVCDVFCLCTTEAHL